MKIGTDINISTCRCEGYTVIEFNKRDLFKGGKLDKGHSVAVTISFPDSWNDSGRPMIGAELPLYSTDTWIDWNSAFELYQDNQEGIDSLCGIGGTDGWNFEQENPSEYDLLTLIDIVNAYCGI